MKSVQKQAQSLAKDTQRWINEIQRAGENVFRGTLWDGIMHKASASVDLLLTPLVCVLKPLAPSFDEASRKVGGGKPLGRLTFGQKTQLLISLDQDLSRSFQDMDPDRFHGRVLGKPGKHLLERMTKIRNDFTHPEDDALEERGGSTALKFEPESTLEFLTLVQAFTESEVVSRAIFLEQRAEPESSAD